MRIEKPRSCANYGGGVDMLSGLVREINVVERKSGTREKGGGGDGHSDIDRRIDKHTRQQPDVWDSRQTDNEWLCAANYGKYSVDKPMHGIKQLVYVVETFN